MVLKALNFDYSTKPSIIYIPCCTPFLNTKLIDMIQDIYKAILANGFTSRGQDVVNNKRLGIKRSFTNELGNYIEIYAEDYGFSVFIYGGDFMNGYFPWSCDILFKKDIDHLRNKIETILA